MLARRLAPGSKMALNLAAARLALTVSFGILLMQACSDSAPGGGGRIPGTSGGAAGSGGARVVAPDTPGSSGAGGASELNPLCGVLTGCVPDDIRACESYEPLQAFAALAGGGAGGGGAAGEAGWAGAGAGGFAGEGGAAGAAGSADTAGHAGAAGAGGARGGATGSGGAGQPPDGSGVGGDPGPPAYACRVSRKRSSVVAECGTTGRGAVDAPCFTGADCSAGLGCATLGAVARCRPYCCSGDSSCASGDYCAERPLSDDSVSSNLVNSVLIPVCVPAERCELGQPYPCPAGTTCQCPGDTACTVVRPDGTTACVAPGTGDLGDRCPCRSGFVCSHADEPGACVKLCATGRSDNADLTCPAGARCQASAELPRGFGICVGG
jgi:hypothetical protein